MEPMLVNSLPIYWGNKQVGLDFNRSSFIDASDYPSLEALVERIVELDINDDEYLSILSESWLNTINYLDWKEKLLAFLIKFLVNFGISKSIWFLMVTGIYIEITCVRC